MTEHALRTGSGDMPSVRRTDAAAVFVGQLFVPDGQRGTAVLERTAGRWAGTPWPPSMLSFSCYLSTDQDTVLTYAQSADADSCRPFVHTLGEAEPWGTVEYRLRRSVVPSGASGVPGCMVVATFDVDGAERQDHLIRTLSDALEDMPADRTAGMLSANFHTATDGTRVLNYAEWTTDEAHTGFLDGAARVTTLRVSGDIPGVRPIGFKRYHLHRSLG
ncbi:MULTISPECIES: antibiotic biosynthesis monooxygenase family protein [unclassified Streptomyces]|uniref:hypothetical protein n=1 Tax=unclassified Streptomyces TaxID=2593676 RepID=UPI0036370ED5